MKSLKQQIRTRYRAHILGRIQRQFQKLQQGDSSDSQLRQWLLASDAVARSNRRIGYGALTLLLLFSTSWVLYPLLQPHLSTAPQRASTPLPPPEQNINNNRLESVFSVQLKIESGTTETDQILEKIRQRPLPIEIKPDGIAGSNRVLLTDSTPTTRQDAERLLSIYSQLFGVDGEIIETTQDGSI